MVGKDGDIRVGDWVLASFDPWQNAPPLSSHGSLKGYVVRSLGSRWYRVDLSCCAFSSAHMVDFPRSSLRKLENENR